MYTILVNKDNSLMTSIRQRIIVGSTNIDDLHILVEPIYNNIDMSKLTAVLTYITPVTHTRNTLALIPSEELYKNRLEYKIKLNESFTSEAGDIRIHMSFLDDDDNVRRETTMGIIHISPRDNIEQTESNNTPTTSSIVDNIFLDTATNEIYLTSGGEVVGNKISVDDLADTVIETTANDGLITVITE